MPTNALRTIRWSRGLATCARATLGLVLLVAGCGPYLGSTAASFLRHTENSDPNIRYLAYAKLGASKSYDNDEQKIEATRLLSRKLGKGTEPVASRGIICRTLGMIGRREALPALRYAINDESPIVRAEAARALGKIGEPDDAVILARMTAADTQSECRIAAIDAIGELKSTDIRILTMLVDGMQPQADAAIRLASHEALSKAVGKDLGVELEPWRKELEKRSAMAKTNAKSKTK